MNDQLEALTAPSVHNGTHTIDSPDGHYVVKIHTVAKGNLRGSRVISILAGSDYVGVAFWDDGKREAIVWVRNRSNAEPRMPIDGYHWNRAWNKTEKKLSVFVDLATRGESSYWAGRGYRLLTEGRCVKCNRKLTDPVSIETGIGPVCAGRAS